MQRALRHPDRLGPSTRCEKAKSMTEKPRHFFLHIPSGESWEVTDPIQWCLDNAHRPTLENAKQGLVGLTSLDQERITRLVCRRCWINLIELQRSRVVVHYWGRDGQGDLSSFFKRHALATKEVFVALCERKHETVVICTGDEFCYGVPLSERFPVELYREKWHRRSMKERDDWQAALGSWSSFCWDGVEPGFVPWTVLKAAWAEETPVCPNCDQSTILTSFGLATCSMFNRRPRFSRICPECRRSFEDHTILNPGQWMASHLDEAVLPRFELVWGRQIKWAPPSALMTC
jgi:hypothetical protein